MQQPGNLIINIRGFSENLEAVSAHVAAFIEGRAQRRAVPGAHHGEALPRPRDTGHGQPYRPGHDFGVTRERMEKVELALFRPPPLPADSVMTAHLNAGAGWWRRWPRFRRRSRWVSQCEADGFKGLITTDYMDMKLVLSSG
ncbi:MAG: hypothetical protein IPP47_22485 [Bryobacterales bacterium]|nr:hypothetical protein [Bryobacterales bacterium]